MDFIFGSVNGCLGCRRSEAIRSCASWISRGVRMRDRQFSGVPGRTRRPRMAIGMVQAKPRQSVSTNFYQNT
jgi:hypothetical protein